MNKTTLRFYQGLDTIGGTILEIKYGNHRAFFEAGRIYNPAFDMYDSHVDKRENFISDYLWTNDIPKIDYIYRKEDLLNSNLKPATESPFNQAFFISHLHLDHMGIMGFIDPSVKIYLSKNAQIIENALEDLGMGVDSIRHKQYEDMPEEVSLGQIHIKRFILNDDSYQDYSFYIETPDLKIHFTGDIFIYGKYFDNIQKEIQYLNQNGVDLLIPEGTTFWANVDENIKVYPTYKPLNLLTKQEHENIISEIIKNHEGLVIFNIYEREMSDVLDFEKYAINSQRNLVFEPQSAYLINKFFNKAVNVIIPDTYIKKPNYLREVINNNSIINKDDILKSPQNYLIQNSYPNLLELLDYKDLNVLYLHAGGQPLGAFDPKYQKLLAFLNNFKIKYQNTSSFNEQYFSNHATREQLLQYLNDVNCKLIIPCHSANRKAYMNNIQKAKFYANLNETYIYNKEKNILEVLKDE